MSVGIILVLIGIYFSGLCVVERVLFLLKSFLDILLWFYKLFPLTENRLIIVLLIYGQCCLNSNF